MTRSRRSLTASASEQLGHVSRIEQILVIAELAIDGDPPALLLDQLLGVGLPEADQRARRALTRATAAELDRQVRGHRTDLPAERQQ